MTYNLFLDDERDPNQVTWLKGFPVNEEWVIARDYPSFVHLIDAFGVPNMVSFDHDLADSVLTGKTCFQYMLAYCHNYAKDLPKEIWVHSMNPIGKKAIENCLIDFYRMREMMLNDK